ncbi:MAG: tetratricopeptide repeat protein [Candidatus Omnitrophica bacterium]|nr:tetratricopeptide repeat protein [Candidatus Omnitrophota bacterium]
MKFLKKYFIDRIEQLNSLELFLIFLFAGLVLYLNVIFYPFVHDDNVFIVNNIGLGRWDNLGDIFFCHNKFSLDNLGIVNSYYRPMLEVFNKILFVFFGRVAFGYHLANIALHALNAFLAYKLTFFFSRRKFFALAVGILFLVHPVQSEAVCAIAGISNLLSTACCFGSFYFYIRHKDLTGRASISYCIYALLLFLIALLAKESTVILPFLLIAYELFYQKPGTKTCSRIKRFLPVLLFFCVLAGYFMFRKLVLSTAFPDFVGNPYELWLRVRAIPQTVLTYAQVLFFPCGLYYYRSTNLLAVSVYPMIILLAASVVIVRALRHFPDEEKSLAYLGLSWFFIALSPTLNIFPLINEYAFILTSEHFLYFPFLGFALFALIFLRRLISWAFHGKGDRIAAIGFILVVVIFAGAARMQSYYWQGEIPLFMRTLRFEPQFGRVRLLLARAYYLNGDYASAVGEYKKGLAIMEWYLRKAKGTSAEKIYRSFIEEAHFALAQTYEHFGRFDQAISAYQQAQEFDPDNERIYNSLGLAYFQVKKPEEAFRCFQKVLALKPNDIIALNNLAFYYLQKKDFLVAEKTLQQALARDPASELTQRNLEEVLRQKNAVLKSRP